MKIIIMLPIYIVPFWENAMLTLEDIRKDKDLLNEIDWGMTPEKAVSVYLEWGSGWELVGDSRLVKSAKDVSYYFVVYFWDDLPVVNFIRRDIQDAEELAEISLPPGLAQEFIQYWGGHKGVYALTPEIEAWLKDELGLKATVH